MTNNRNGSTSGLPNFLIASILAIAWLAGCGSPESTPEIDDTETAPPTETPSPAAAQSEDDAEPVESEDDFTSILAQMAVLEWAEGLHGEALIEPVPMFFGDLNGDGVDDVLAVIYAETGVSGSLVEPTVFLRDGETFVPYETLSQISGFDPRNVVLSYGKVALTTTVHQDGDAACCPSGEANWSLDLDF